jgi:hypothetical protein
MTDEPNPTEGATDDEQLSELDLPQADFLTLVASLAGQAAIHLGIVENPLKKKVRKDLRQARYTIDLIAVLEEKTRGNLSSEEKKVMERVLADLRMRFVEASK